MVIGVWTVSPVKMYTKILKMFKNVGNNEFFTGNNYSKIVMLAKFDS